MPSDKVKGEIAKVSGLQEGIPAKSPATFTDLNTVCDIAELANEVREIIGEIPEYPFRNEAFQLFDSSNGCTIEN